MLSPRTSLRRTFPSSRTDRDRREAFFDEAREWTKHIAVQLGEEVLFLATDDAGVSKKVFVTGTRGDIALLERAVETIGTLGVALPAEPVFLEVGANIGTTTVMAVRRHRFSGAVALEPSSESFRLLRINLVANGIDDRVLAVPAAASDREGELALDVSAPNGGQHQVVTVTEGQPRAGLTVRAVTVDQLVAAGTPKREHVGLLWVDAAKHDPHVLLGASELLRSGVPLVTAIRVTGDARAHLRPWNAQPAVKSDVLALLGDSYTDVVVLESTSKLQAVHSIRDVASLVDSFRRDANVLFVRR